MTVNGLRPFDCDLQKTAKYRCCAVESIKEYNLSWQKIAFKTIRKLQVSLPPPRRECAYDEIIWVLKLDDCEKFFLRWRKNVSKNCDRSWQYFYHFSHWGDWYIISWIIDAFWRYLPVEISSGAIGRHPKARATDGQGLQLQSLIKSLIYSPLYYLIKF